MSDSTILDMIGFRYSIVMVLGSSNEWKLDNTLFSQ